MKTAVRIHLLFARIATDADQAALWELHHAYYQRLFRFIWSLVRNRESAEEITNDVFIRLWQKRNLLHNIHSPEVYLFVCAKNLALKHLKRPTLFTEQYDDLSDFELIVEKSPEDILISSEMLRRINKAILQLPPKCKLIFQLVKENNLKYKEVAAILDISEKTVENQMSIALKKLSQSIPLSLRFSLT